MTQGRYRALIAHVLIFALAVFVAGCGGGESGSTPAPDPGTPDPTGPTVSAEDIFPDTGLVVHVEVGQEAILNGSGSTTSTALPLTYAWSFTHKPDGSKTVLQDATTVSPRFLADVRGTYMVRLVVSVGGVSGQPVIASVEATNDYSADIPRPDHTKNTAIKFRSQCVDCHVGGPGEVIGKSPAHIESSDLCQACHSILTFTTVPYVDHEQFTAAGNCDQCHNGVSAIGKSDQHEPTTSQCDECHTNTISFLFIEADGSYDHSGISSGCTRCHNTVLAIGMDDDHLITEADCVMCHNTEAFRSATFDHSGYTGTCARSGCHTGLPDEAMGQPEVHPDTYTLNIDCKECHNFKSFALDNSYDHAAVISSELACNECHDGDNAVAMLKSQNHIDTSVDCGSCHNTTDFKAAYVDHTSDVVIGNVPGSNPPVPITCASCHNNDANSPAPGLSLNHMPTTEDCGRCHTPGTFASGIFDHVVDNLPVTANCMSCHNDVIAVDKPIAHIPTSEDCSVCHETDTFTGVVFSHAGIDVKNCAVCHDSGISTGKHRDHLPTTADCSVCHGTDYSSFANGNFHNNVDVTADCASCHNRVIATGKSRTTHIPTQDDCSVCHVVASAFQPSKFLTGVHTNITTDCVQCHTGEFTTPNVTVEGKSPDHIATSNLCETCHSVSAFAPVASVDHQQVFGVCSDCHDGVKAIGKSDQHVPTKGECDDCHTSTTSFLFVDLNGNYDHTDILGDCARCHSGVLAIGKDVGHVDTTSECNVCHTTTAFIPATFDHSTITQSCATCHGSTAPGQPLGHPDTNAVNIDCGICHNTTNFNMGNTFNHALILSTDLACASCHDGANAVAIVKPQDHPALDQPEPDCGMCHTTTAFKPAFVDHSTLTANCARSGCHDGADPTIKSKHTNHLPTEVDCAVCHTPGTFTSGTFDHLQANTTNPIDTCTSCHNDVIVSGLPGNHIPTTAECVVCHTTDTFVGAIFKHTEIDVSNCAECHNGTYSIGKDINHLPTSENCSLCHDADYTTFTTGNFHNNVVVTANCASCHDTVIATGKPRRTHIPAQDDCSVCHDVSSAFKPSKFYTNVHVNIISGCEGCHNGNFTTSNGPVAAKAIDHLPTNQDCDVCHTTDVFTPSIFAHVGISGNCVSCHDGTHDASGAIGLSPTHIPTTADCDACHNITNLAFKPAFVDHTSTAVTGVTCVSCHYGTATGGATGKADKPLGTHVQTDQDCGICHVSGGTFAPAVFDHNNLPGNTRCDSCHGVTATGQDAKTNPPHAQTTEDCKVCHNTTAFAGAKYNHQGIVDGCVACHDGVIAIGKHSNHVPTHDRCEECHQTTGFVPATFDHAGIVDNCASCHDGVFAIGKNSAVNHPTTNADCGVCHTTDTFTGAGFNHLEANGAPVTTDCARSGCHGDGATGMDAKTNPPHLATTLDCSNCHTTASFIGGIWVHGPETAGVCLDCHVTNGGATPMPPPPGHFESAQQCDVCHTTDGWAPANTYVHPNNSTYPGDHNRNVVCISCHTTNTQEVTYPSNLNRTPRLPPFGLSQYWPACAGCHEKDFRPEGDHIGGDNGTVEQNKNCGASGCHRVSANGF